MSILRYKVDVYNRGVISTTGTIDYTLMSSRLSGPPASMGGYTARPLDGRVEGQPWALPVLDVNSTFTGRIADSSGRLQQMGRLVRVRQSVNSTASSSYVSQIVGRVSDVLLDPNVAGYTVMVSDERIVERNTKIFTKIDDAVSLMPGGLVKNAPPGLISVPGGRAEWTCLKRRGNIVLLGLTDRRGQYPLGQAVVDALTQDVKPNVVFPIAGATGLTTGLWTKARWKNVATSANYPVAGFGFDPKTAVDFFGFPADPAVGIGAAIAGSSIKSSVWLVWPTSPPAVATRVYGYLHMSGAIPSPAVPLFVGGEKGSHPGSLAKVIYQNTYSDSTAQTVRFSTGAFDTWTNDPSYGKVWFRITQPMVMADFLESRVYAPYGIIPTIDSSGKVAPRSILLPSSNQLNINSLLTLTSTNLIGHPTWANQGREVVNALSMKTEQYRLPAPGEARFIGRGRVLPGAPGDAESADRIVSSTIHRRFTHDNTTKLGLREREYSYGAISLPLLRVSSGAAGYWGGFPDTLMTRLAKTVFDRFGDGPIYNDVACMASVDNTSLGRVKIGDYAKIKLATFPNPTASARGSTRIVQIMGRADSPGIPQFSCLDMGPASNPLATPALAVAASSLSSRHALKATVSALAAGARYEIRLASESTGTTSVPGVTSSKWQTAAVGSSTGLVQHIYRLASRRRWFAEVRAVKKLRINSAWSSGSNAITASIAAPTAVASSVTGRRAVLRWTYGSSLYPTNIYLSNTSAAFVSGSSNQVDQVIPLTTRYQLTDLTAGATHRANLWHADPFGGFGINGTVVFAVGATTSAAPSMKGLTIVQGRP